MSIPRTDLAAAGGAQGDTTVLQARDLFLSFGSTPALRGASLSVRRGEVVAVMGPSGSGKSTLLTIAGSLEDPTSGEVRIGGRSLSTMSGNDKARLRRRTVGFVFQDFNLLAGLTAAENVALPLELDGTPARKAARVALEALDRLGLAERAGH
ncbi:MAG TPA: ATP-binding cassette domain-containing protein, partial [Trebonia sp.]|nr:ATP-binding cassette domain-containing protein [Trebonia sp.]